MLEWVKFIFDALKQVGGYAPVSVLGASSILLFVPNIWLAKINVLAFKTQNAETIGLAFVVSLVAVVIQAILWVKNNPWASHQARKNMEKRFSNLTDKERQLLWGYIFGCTRTQYFPYQDGVVQGLVHAKVIYLASQVSTRWYRFPFNIQPWAYDYLRKHPHLLLDDEQLLDPDLVLEPYRSDLENIV